MIVKLLKSLNEKFQIFRANQLFKIAYARNPQKAILEAYLGAFASLKERTDLNDRLIGIQALDIVYKYVTEDLELQWIDPSLDSLENLEEKRFRPFSGGKGGSK